MHNLWLAYAFDNEEEPPAIEAAIERVTEHYSQTSAEPWVRRGWADAKLGALVFDVEDPPCRWPVWAEDGSLGVASAYPALGWRRVVGELFPEQAPIPLARALVADPDRIGEITPPFGMAVFDRDREELKIVNDALGYARLYEMRFQSGTVWSNRAGACGLFAGEPPSLSERGWHTFATVGWFMRDTMPFDGVRPIPPGTVVTASAGALRHESTSALARWVAPREPKAVDGESIASALVETIRDAAELWPDTPQIDLSGGRDSRRVAAVAVAAGIDAEFMTIRTYDGEVSTAEELMKIAPRKLRHEIVETGDPITSGDLRERTLMLHQIFDGTYYPRGIGQSLMHPQRPRRWPQISGASAGVGRAVYYDERHLEHAENADEKLLDKRVRMAHSFGRGSTPEATATGFECARAALRDAEDVGLEGLMRLDYLYLTERVRRWQIDPLRIAKITMYLTPAFVRAGFDLTPQQRVEDPLGELALRASVPEWTEVPYYVRKNIKPGRPRLWEGGDTQFFEEIVLPDEDAWGGFFDADTVRRMWSEARDGSGTNKHQDVCERVVWLTFFNEHLARLRSAATAGDRAARR